MIKVTLYTTDKECTEIGSATFAHISMFKDNNIVLSFISTDEQLKFIALCIKHYVKFECQGQSVCLIRETNNFQRVCYRFDSL